MEQSCFICRKNAGLEAPPPGGYVYEDVYWKVGHAPSDMVGLGTLVVESTRHYLDFSGMETDEAASFGGLMAKLYAALMAETGAERVYCALFAEGAPHFHVWLVPRYPGGEVRGPALLDQSSCDETEAIALAAALRKRLEEKNHESSFVSGTD
jgi:diadenosine tetraphosphate (Ap4A) HIT family hydrolase